MPGEELLGRLATGIGHGRHFTQLDWARQQFVDKLCIDPFPGTINLIVEDSESMQVWNRLKDTPGVRIDNPNDGPHDCDARCYPVLINDQIDAAIVLPEVAGYSPVQIEVIAAMGVRDALAHGYLGELWHKDGLRQRSQPTALEPIQSPLPRGHHFYPSAWLRGKGP
jgi:CTP-dependent riboflavin kinase